MYVPYSGTKWHDGSGMKGAYGTREYRESRLPPLLYRAALPAGTPPGATPGGGGGPPGTPAGGPVHPPGPVALAIRAVEF